MCTECHERPIEYRIVARCKKCHWRIKSQAYYQVHKNSISARTRQYRLDHPGYDTESKRVYREKNQELCQERTALWRQRTPWKHAGYEAKRRAQKRQVPCEDFTVMDIINRDGWKCWLCSRDVTIEQASIDHVIPLSLAGPHILGNVRLAHLLCNIRRGNRPAEVAS